MGAPAGPQYIQIIDTTGPLVGATIEYTDLSDNARAVYSDATLLTSLGGTLSGGNASDSKGRFPIHFLDPSLDYKRVIKTSAGATWRTDNPVQTANDDLADYLPLAGGTMTGALFLKEGAAVASAATVNLNTVTGNMVHVTGTTGISAITLTTGQILLVFDDAVTLTHSSNLILPGSDNITTAAGDSVWAVGEGGGVTRLVGYTLANGKPLIEPVELLIGVGDETTTILTGTSKRTLRSPCAITLDAIPRASLTTAQASGANKVTIDINVSASSILSTKLTIDNNATTSEAASTAAVLSSTSIADDASITIDIDNCDGSTTAAGLKVLLRGYRRNRS
jgi:hypothetical protein